MSALDWIRRNATQFDQDELEVEGVKYVATLYRFKGRVPKKMVYDLTRELSSLVVTETERERLLVGGQYRSDFNKCEYSRVVYTKAA